MDVIVLLVFVSLVLVAAALVFFFTRLRGGDFDHGERLALLPLHDDDGEDAAHTAEDAAPAATEESPTGNPDEEDGHSDGSR
jgi:cbb3-type cytochrome oxidase maturation protein